MKLRISFLRALTCGFLFFFLMHRIRAQQYDCKLKDPVILIHFGRGDVPDINAVVPSNYDRINGSCPMDGHYTFTSYTSDCFYGDWFTIPEDHTPGDQNGNMMLVNASPSGGIFLTKTLSGLKGNTTYELGAWMMNVCKIGGGCPALPPKIIMRLTNTSGKVIKDLYTGELTQMDAPHWTQYTGMFTMPEGETSLVLIMMDITIGGCGNDFALDDITFRECVKTDPQVAEIIKPIPLPVVKQQTPAKKPEIKKDPVDQPIQKQIPKAATVTRLTRDTLKQVVPLVNQQTVALLPKPTVLKTRENPLVKQIEVPAGEIKIDLYDNGEIDGDTVSVYHNNELIVFRAMLSQKPITVRFMVDQQRPYHELIMVANNLGSIPPNTSLMIVTTKDKRYEVFISSTEQKNAKVVIVLRE
jgi:hypothetical protein